MEHKLLNFCMTGVDEVDRESKLSKLPAIEGSNPDIAIQEETEDNDNKNGDDGDGIDKHHTCDKTDSSVNIKWQCWRRLCIKSKF